MAKIPHSFKNNFDWEAIYNQYTSSGLSYRKFYSNVFVPYVKNLGIDITVPSDGCFLHYMHTMANKGDLSRLETIQLKWNDIYDEFIQSGCKNYSVFYNKSSYLTEYSISYFYRKMQEIHNAREPLSTETAKSLVVPVLNLEEQIKQISKENDSGTTAAHEPSKGVLKALEIRVDNVTITYKTNTPEYSIALIINSLKRLGAK